MTSQQQKLFIEYLIEAESIVADNNKKVSKEAKDTAKDIIAICLLYGINISDFKYSKLPEKTKVELRAKLSDLRQSLFDTILDSSERTKSVSRSLNNALELGYNELDFDTKEYIERDIADKTIHQRINEQVNRFSFEIEAYIAIGIISKLKAEKILDSIWNNRNAPFASRIVSDAMKAGGFSAVRLAKEYHPNRGFSSSALRQLERIGEMTIMGVYGKYNELFWTGLNKNVKFRTLTTSSNPCAICVDSQKVLHDYNPIPYHPRCQCVCYPTFLDK